MLAALDHLDPDDRLVITPDKPYEITYWLFQVVLILAYGIFIQSGLQLRSGEFNAGDAELFTFSGALCGALLISMTINAAQAFISRGGPPGQSLKSFYDMCLLLPGGPLWHHRPPQKIRQLHAQALTDHARALRDIATAHAATGDVAALSLLERAALFLEHTWDSLSADVARSETENIQRCAADVASVLHQHEIDHYCDVVLRFHGITAMHKKNAALFATMLQNTDVLLDITPFPVESTLNAPTEDLVALAEECAYRCGIAAKIGHEAERLSWVQGNPYDYWRTVFFDALQKIRAAYP